MTSARGRRMGVKFDQGAAFLIPCEETVVMRTTGRGRICSL